MMDLEDFKDIIVICLIVGGIIIILLWCIVVSSNWQQRVNCDLMHENGNSVKMQYFKMLFFDMEDCYVGVGEGKFVPYDRYRGVD